MVLTAYRKILPIVLFYVNIILPDYNFILHEELFAKVQQSLETCSLVNNNLCGKLFSSLESPTANDKSFKTTSAPFFIPDFDLLSRKLDNFTYR